MSSTPAKPPQISTGQSQRDELWLEVVEFLKSNMFDQYIQSFQDEGFDRMDALYDLTMDDLLEMKVKKGHARRILTEITKHRKEHENLSPSKRVRFSYSKIAPVDGSQTTVIKTNLHTVDETKHHTPKSAISSDETPTPNVYAQAAEKPNLKNATSDSLSTSQNYYHTNINPRNQKLAAPQNIHPHQLSTSSGGLSAVSDSTRTILIRSSSVRSDGSDFPEDGAHFYDNSSMKPMIGRMVSQKSMSRLSHSYSHSNAGTVVIRQSVVEPYDYGDSVYSHRTRSVSGYNPMSPAMSPIVPDMHNDLHSLIESLGNAKIENNPHFDEYHEALVNVTSTWDREKCEKNLKYLNAKDNYSNWVILDLLGVLNAQLGRTEDAIKYHSDSIKKSGDKYIEAMHNYAYLLHRIGGVENDMLSVKLYKQALAINDKFAHSWLHYGNLLEDEGKGKEAVSMYQKAIKIRPSNAAFHLDLANCYDDLNEFEDASEEYQKCIELQPNDPVYHWNYAISLENQGFYFKAEEAYKRAINLDFGCIDAHINYAHMLENAKPTPQLKKAMKEYQILLKIPEMMYNTEIMLKCAKLCHKFGENAQCEELYMSILQFDPTIEEAYIGFAKYLTDQNRIEDANACYQAGIRHVQTPKLQEEYIQFLKDINNLYNNRKPKHKPTNSNINGFKQKMSNINTSGSARAGYVPPSPFVSSVKAQDNHNMNGYKINDQTGYDYYRPGPSTKNTQQNRGGNKKTARNNAAAPNANGNEEGCIVM